MGHFLGIPTHPWEGMRLSGYRGISGYLALSLAPEYPSIAASIGVYGPLVSPTLRGIFPSAFWRCICNTVNTSILGKILSPLIFPAGPPGAIPDAAPAGRGV